MTRWWHLSKSAIFFGNQWTKAENETVQFSAACFNIDYISILFYKNSNRLLHLTSLVVLTSSAFLFMELIRVLTSERCTSQRTKYSRPSRLSLSFRHGRVSKWWILDSNVWNTVNTLKCYSCITFKHDKGFGWCSQRCAHMKYVRKRVGHVF